MRKVRLKLQPQVGTAHPLLQEALSDDDAAEGQGHKHFRACGRVFKATIARADSDFYDDACFVVRYAASEPGGISRRAGIPAVHGGWESASAGAVLHATNSREAAAVGSADCPVSGFAGGADHGGVYVSRASRRGRQMGASAS